jgi:hypothetical protein
MKKPAKDLERASLWPNPGQLIRHDTTLQHIKPGDNVVITPHIARCIKRGDLHRSDPGAAKEAPARTKAKHAAESEG